jgi:hypothetical protein
MSEGIGDLFGGEDASRPSTPPVVLIVVDSEILRYLAQ